MRLSASDFQVREACRNLDEDFAGSGAPEFPTFYDHAEARTPQLALHQRWLDLIQERQRFDNSKKDAHTQNVSRDVQKLQESMKAVEETQTKVNRMEDTQQQLVKQLANITEMLLKAIDAKVEK